VHFHSVPYHAAHLPGQGARARRAADEWQYDSKLVLVPFGEIQREVVLTVPPPARVVVYRG